MCLFERLISKSSLEVMAFNLDFQLILQFSQSAGLVGLSAKLIYYF